MPRPLPAALFAGLALLICPLAAQASPPAQHRPSRPVATGIHRLPLQSGRGEEVGRALRIAETYWGSAPCAGEIVVSAAQPVPSGMASDTDAWVTFDSSLGVDDLAAPASTYTACRIGLARWQWPTPASISSDWGMFCLTVIHEIGHLMGHPHSTLPGSVMAPVFSGEASVPPVCRPDSRPRGKSSRRAYRPKGN